MSNTAERLQTFVQFVLAHLKGDEKGEAQLFLDKFFRAFGHEGAIEAGATYEERIHKGSKKGKTGFADLVWKPRVLIEMKKRGADLTKHYSQAFDYWQRAVPNRPRYVMLCNFDEFWVYDFDMQIDTPIDIVALADLPDRVATFGFMEVTERQSVFGNNQVEVTEKAAGRMGELYQMLRDRLLRQGLPNGVVAIGRSPLQNAELVAQRFVLQCVLAMFAEDRQLLPRSLFVRSVQDCLQGESSYDVIGGLFRAMNSRDVVPAGRFQGVEYFNGGLFAEIHPLELTPPELKFLEVSALEDWSKVRPAIFGNIFESAIDEKDRHAHGIHYTAEADIMKIVRPTISRYWEERIDQANTIKQLEALQIELRDYRVLDPACGSGNFLYIAYQELKQIEQDLLDKIAERRRTADLQMQMGYVTPLQFFGIDNNPFAVELARVTLMIARKVAIDRLGLYEPALPLDTLDQNIRCQDALFTDWPQADAIIGNPPILGRGKTKTLNDTDPNYTKKLHSIYPKKEFPSSADFCYYWFRKAHEYPTERIGLVGSNSITQGNSRKASLDFILMHGGVIYDAISSQPWSGEAVVHVSIANWSKTAEDVLYLDSIPVKSINSSLKDEIDVTKSVKLKSNLNFCFQGVVPQPLERYLIDDETASIWFKQDPKNKDVVRNLLSADELTNTHDMTSIRFLIDFNKMSIEDASMYKLPFDFVKQSYESSLKNNNDEHKKWWQLWRPRIKMKSAIAELSEYIAMPGHSKWFIPVKVPKDYLAYVNSSFVIASEDYYLLGVLTSQVHRVWVTAQSSTIKGDTRYTNTTCFETFPFPQIPPAPLAKGGGDSRGDLNQAIRAHALQLHHSR
ncbi:MAG: DNA methyltransferase, partial [Leptolyngbyaceae cyanobacterium]